MGGTAGMLPDRETQIDSSNPAIADLTARMFAGEIADGSVVVDDPAPAPAPAPVAAPRPPVAEVPEPPTTEPAAPEPPAAAVVPENVPTFKPKLNDDLQALLDEPDFEEEAALEVAAEVETGEYEYTDPEIAAKLRALEKRNAFLEGQVIAKSRKGWVEEAKRAYPDLARLIPGEIEGTQATSRRAFMRAVDAANTRYSTVLAPTIQRLEAERAAITSGAVAVAREEVANAWGRPAGDTLPPVAAAQQEALEKARKAGDLDAGIKALMETHQVL